MLAVQHCECESGGVFKGRDFTFKKEKKSGHSPVDGYLVVYVLAIVSKAAVNMRVPMYCQTVLLFV